MAASMSFIPVKLKTKQGLFIEFEDRFVNESPKSVNRHSPVFDVCGEQKGTLGSWVNSIFKDNEDVKPDRFDRIVHLSLKRDSTFVTLGHLKDTKRAKKVINAYGLFLTS